MNERRSAGPVNELIGERSPQMRPNHEERKALKLEFCERCAIAENPAVIFAEGERVRMFQNLLHSGFRPV